MEKKTSTFSKHSHFGSGSAFSPLHLPTDVLVVHEALNVEQKWHVLRAHPLLALLRFIEKTQPSPE